MRWFQGEQANRRGDLFVALKTQDKARSQAESKRMCFATQYKVKKEKCLSVEPRPGNANKRQHTKRISICSLHLGRKKQTLKFIARPHFSRLSNWVAAAVVLSAMIPSVAVLTILLLPA